MQAKKSRLVDVARLSGVSVATVSNVVNRRTKVSEHTRVRVETVLKQLDYKPNEHALALRRESLVQRLDPASSSSESSVGILGSGDAIEGSEHAEAYAGPLSDGDDISVHVNGQVMRGVVDAQMPDGSGFWVWCIGAGRKFVSSDDHPVVSRFPAETGSAVAAKPSGEGLTGLPTPFI